MVATYTALVLASSAVAAAFSNQVPLTTNDDGTCSAEPAGECNPKPLTPAAVYFGDQPQNCSIPTKLRISNGGAGLSGLVECLADKFIESGWAEDAKPFKVEWIKGDTTETLEYLRTNQADVGITYNKAAECQAINDEVASRRVYGFRDHFYLVGPKDDGSGNPAGLKPANVTEKQTENVLKQFQSIVRTGNQPPLKGRPTRFLSRYDKSATNIKDSELFVRIGQVPWGLAYSRWYHQYTMYPIDALEAAALLKEYTITDRGTWLSTDKKFTDQLTIYNVGLDEKPTDPLLNPAFFLTSSSSCGENTEVANRFLDWVVGSDGQNVIKHFKKGNPSEYLYSEAPPYNKEYQDIRDCSVSSL